MGFFKALKEIEDEDLDFTKNESIENRYVRGRKTLIACCCHAQTAVHDESQKFIKMGDSEAWDVPLF